MRSLHVWKQLLVILSDLTFTDLSTGVTVYCLTDRDLEGLHLIHSVSERREAELQKPGILVYRIANIFEENLDIFK